MVTGTERTEILDAIKENGKTISDLRDSVIEYQTLQKEDRKLLQEICRDWYGENGF